MGAITNKCFELLKTSGQYEERRSQRIYIRSTANFIDAAHEPAETVGSGGKNDKAKDSGNLFERWHQAINDIL